MRPARTCPIVACVVLAILPSTLGAAPRVDPSLRRLIGGPGPAGLPAGAPGPAELQMLARQIVLDTAATPPRVHVWMKLDAAGRQAVRALGIRPESDLPGMISAFVPIPQLGALAASPGIEWMQASRRYRLELDVSLPLIGVPQVWSAYAERGAGVIVANIDSGVDLTHGDFRRPDGTTRLLSIWDQTGSALTDPACTPPPGFSFGCFYDAADIDAFLTGGGTLRFPNADGHGSMTLGIAGGDGSQTGNGAPADVFVGVAPEADLISVKMFGEPGEPACGACNLGDALTFIDQQAALHGGPWVANVSFGDQYGGHDGGEADEILIDTLTGPGRAGQAVVKSAGNDRGARIHASGTLTAGASVNHTFTIPSYAASPGTFNDLQVFYMWYDGGNNYTVTLTGPNGGTFSRTTGGGFGGADTVDGVIIITDSGSPAPNGTRFFQVQVDDQFGTPPTAGTWTFHVQRNGGAGSARHDAWIVQSTFGNSHKIADWTTYDLSRLVSAPGNSLYITTVGGFYSKTEWPNFDGDITEFVPPLPLGALADFSAPGPSRDGRTKPEVAAPGETIASVLSADARPAVLADSFDRLRVTPDGWHWGLGGTSFAAPHVTGIYALMLGINPSLDAVQMRTLLTGAAVTDTFTGATPNGDWGYGKIDATAALEGVIQPIPDLAATGGGGFAFSAIPQSDTYDVFRTPLATLDGSNYGPCFQTGLAMPTFNDPTTPAIGAGYGYLVGGRQGGVIGQIGQRSDGTWRPRPTCP